MGDAWHWIRSGAGDAPGNMAWDEALLEAAASLATPVFRSYAWEAPAATFGYFQRHAEIAAWTPLRPLLRRPTGGGLVPHASDWTYAIILPPQHAWYSLPAVESYRRAHRWLQRAFGLCGVETRLSPCCDPAGPGRCFVGAEREDLLLGDGKVAGAAQRRNRLGLLIQGSVQPTPDGLERARWEEALMEAARLDWQASWSDLPTPDEAWLRRLSELRTRYASRAHNERR